MRPIIEIEELEKFLHENGLLIRDFEKQTIIGFKVKLEHEGEAMPGAQFFDEIFVLDRISNPDKNEENFIDLALSKGLFNDTLNRKFRPRKMKNAGLI